MLDKDGLEPFQVLRDLEELQNALDEITALGGAFSSIRLRYPNIRFVTHSAVLNNFERTTLTRNLYEIENVINKMLRVCCPTCQFRMPFYRPYYEHDPIHPQGTIRRHQFTRDLDEIENAVQEIETCFGGDPQPILAGTRDTGGTAGTATALRFHSHDAATRTLTLLQSYSHYRGGGWGYQKQRFCYVSFPAVGSDSGPESHIGFVDTSDADSANWTLNDILDIPAAPFSAVQYPSMRYVGPYGNHIAFRATPTGYVAGDYALYLIDASDGSIDYVVEHSDLSHFGDSGTILDYAFSIDGRFFAVWGDADTGGMSFVRAYDRTTGVNLLDLVNPGPTYSAGGRQDGMHFSEDGEWFYFLTADAGTRVYRTSDWQLDHTLAWYTGGSPSIATPAQLLSPLNTYFVGGISSFFFDNANVIFRNFDGTVFLDTGMGNSQWRPDGNNADWTEDEAFCFIGGGHTDVSGGYQSWKLSDSVRVIHGTDDEILARWRPFR